MVVGKKKGKKDDTSQQKLVPLKNVPPSSEAVTRRETRQERTVDEDGMEVFLSFFLHLICK